MRSTTSLPRKRLGRTRAATALAAAGALIMSAGVIGLIASPASADHNGKPGNHGKAGENGPKNENPGVQPGQEDLKISLCHRTNSETNPYVNFEGITISKNGVIQAGHGGHEGPVFAEGMKADKIKWGDIIPPFTWTDQKGGQHSYAGMNWTSAGQAIFNNGCQVPDTPPPTDCPPGQTDYNGTAPGCGSPPPPPGGLEDLSPAVAFTDADCDTLGSEDWDGTLEAFVDYEETGEVGPGETVTVEAMIEPGYTDEYEFAPGAQTEFTHTFDDVTLADCVAGEETVIPKPDKPEPKPDKEPTVKGVEVVVPPAAPPAAAPTAVAAGLGSPTESPLQTIAQMLVAGGMLLLMAGVWIGLGRRESGTHEA